ncbi:uncharacterized protein LOC119361554 [Triticum dicoccoides]|uniref:uncharacterized protein LOC119361554 n=1 Tax=Triticum dicoccoides TaxID=85692 RepID=UPI00188EE937|nr:uncharacterized protein LOC119361554 [Triticum dicoccoides]
MPPRPTVDDTVDATPLHLHAISRRLRTTSNSTTLCNPRPTPSGRNTIPKYHRRPNRGTEAFACAHGRGGGRMIHTEASRKVISAEGVNFGAAAHAGLEFRPDPCPPARSVQAKLASTEVATVASTNRSRSSWRRCLPWNSGRQSRSRRSAAASTPPTQPWKAPVCTRGCRPPGRPHRAPPIEAAAARSPRRLGHRRSDLKQIDHDHHRRAPNSPPRDHRGKQLLSSPPQPSLARPIANAPPIAAERHPRQCERMKNLIKFWSAVTTATTHVMFLHCTESPRPRSECTPEEIAKLDAESAKRRERRAVVKVNAAAAKRAAQHKELEAARRKARYMEDVIFDGGHGRTYDPEEIQSQDGRAEYVPDEEADDRADYDHGDSWHEDDDIYVEGDAEEEESNDVDISGASLFIDKLTQGAEAQKKRKSIRTAFQSLEAFKARHNDKPFTVTHCWTIINNCPKFKDQYRELQRKRGMKTVKFAGGGDGEALKRPRGNTNSKVDDIRDASSMALHETLHGMVSQKDVRDEKKRQSKDEQMKQYLDHQRQKLEMEEVAKRRKIDMEEAARQRQLDIEADNVKARQRQLDIEATNAATKAKEVALAIMSVDLSKMSDKTRAWFEARQKEMLDAEGLN